MLISVTFSVIRYLEQYQKHNRLAANGQEVKLTAVKYTSIGVTNVNYTFTTLSGQKKEHYEKCGNNFERYRAATAIYNPADPDDYELSFTFNEYSPFGRFIFFLIIIIPAMTFVTYGFLKLAVMIYFMFKRN